VKAVNDSNLNDIGLMDTVCNVRHALALFERRKPVAVERFDLPDIEGMIDGEHSFQEAWFAGTHGNLGGACEEDGLALWPLQWVLTEAQKFGLVCEFKGDASNISDPAEVIFPKDRGPPKEIRCQNGIVSL
jgi:hypothetical protein